jgi:hypothetical protein
MSQHALDLTRYQWRKEIHDLMIYGTWLYNEDQEDTEPALVIVPRYRQYGAKPCAIALSSAFKYNDPRYLARAAGIFAERMGFEPSMTTTHRIAMLIDDHLGDLIKMPVDPTQAVQVGEAVLDMGNGNRQTVGLMDYEQIRQS